MASSTSDGEAQVRKGPVSFPSLDVEFSSESWGPMRVPERYRDMPFAPFSKGDRLGKVSDFGGYLAYTQRMYTIGMVKHKMAEKDECVLLDGCRLRPRWTRGKC